MTTVPPVHREIVVDADPAAAFEVFTAGIGRWWPLASHSVYETESASVAFADGQIVERSADGRTSLWGTVTRWEPAAAVAFTWHPGRSPEGAGHVEVTFAAAGAQTLGHARNEVRPQGPYGSLRLAAKPAASAICAASANPAASAAG